jgi:hypothetical protein
VAAVASNVAQAIPRTSVKNKNRRQMTVNMVQQVCRERASTPVACGGESGEEVLKSTWLLAIENVVFGESIPIRRQTCSIPDEAYMWHKMIEYLLFYQVADYKEVTSQYLPLDTATPTSTLVT